MRGDDNRLRRHVRQFGRAAVLVPVFLVQAGTAFAINWEGHDEWFHDTTPFRAFYDGIPAPKVKPLPDCTARQAQYEKNRYEQIPLPGRNCKVTPGGGS